MPKKSMTGRQGYTGRNRKRDANEPELLDELGKCPGVSVYPLDKPLDLLAGFAGITDLLEVKNPDGADRIEPDQSAFIADWKGRPPIIVRTRADIRAWYAMVQHETGADQGGLSGARFPRPT